MMSDTQQQVGYFGEFGGSFVPPQLQEVLDYFSVTYCELNVSPQECGYQLAPTNHVRSTGLVSSFQPGSSGLSGAAGGVCSEFVVDGEEEGFEFVLSDLEHADKPSNKMTDIMMAIDSLFSLVFITSSPFL